MFVKLAAFLIAEMTIGLALVLGAAPSYAAADCGILEQMTASCPASNGAITGGGVEVSAGVDSGSNGQGGENPGTGGTGVEGTTGNVGGGGTAVGPDAIDRDGFIVNCIANSPCDPSFRVSIRDLVNFVPSNATTGMEPNGWAVVGLPANFIADASTHTRSGMLLGFVADVRFTPIGYDWNFGDGTSLSHTSHGSTWAAQGLAEFSDTSTSHRYATSGTFTIVGSVNYTAEYRFAGQDWRSIAGILAISAEPFTAVAGQAKTVLVNNGCHADSRGPGC